MNNTRPLLPDHIAELTVAHPGVFELRLLWTRPLLFLDTPAEAAVEKAARAVGFRPASSGHGWVLPL